MPITIPNRQMVRPTTTPRPFPNSAKSGTTNPCPVGISATGSAPSGNPLLERTRVRPGYVGYNVRSDVPDGATGDEAFAPVRDCIVDGFSGVTPKSEVYIEDAAAPDPQADFSGVTHTPPAGATRADAIGVGVTSTKIFFYA